ncbi:MAG: hypothetical protein HY328_03985 [Chloroflexi bacterium]|nr:hypothetical protein [Chloroflexota bacterium]
MKLNGFRTIIWLLLPAIVALIFSPPVLSQFQDRVTALPSATFVVDSLGEEGDIDPGDGVCATPQNTCTLFAAISESNRLPGNHTITFGITGAISTSLSGCPHYRIRSEGLVIDATGQSVDGAPGVVFRLDSNSTGRAVEGLCIQANNVTIKGLQIENFLIGIRVDGNDNTIERNVLVDNGQAIAILPGFANNVVIGNLIGLNAEGVAVPNGIGIRVEGNDNIIGTGNSGEGNVISGNRGDVGLEGYGVVLHGSRNVVAGNLVGTDPTGTQAIGNQRSGILVVFLSSASGVPRDNRIGVSTNASEGNIIGGNGHDGITVSGNAKGTIVAGNSIGTAGTGANLGNTNNGVFDEAIFTRIGSDGDGVNDEIEGNRIAHNGNGVALFPGAGGARISRNSIFANPGLGIDLFQSDPPQGGPSANDPGDVDEFGANRLQNWPEISQISPSGGQLQVRFRVDTATIRATYPLTVEFFIAESTAITASGQVYLASVLYPADEAQHTVTRSFVPSQMPGPGAPIVATAIDAQGNTSEFSFPPVLVGVPAQPDLLIKQLGEPDTAYALDDVYQTVPTGDQIETQDATANIHAEYDVKLENDGDTAASFVLRVSEEGASEWLTSYLAPDGASLFPSEPYTTASLEPGESELVSVRMTPMAALTRGETMTATFQVFLDAADTVPLDAVQAVAKAPFLDVRKETEIIPSPVAPGQLITYTVRLFWSGPDGAVAPGILADRIPDHTEFVAGSASATLGQVDFVTNKIEWSGDLVANESLALIRFTVRVACSSLMALNNADWPQFIRNQATGTLGPYDWQVEKSSILSKPDLQIAGLEVTQAIQDLANAAPLVKDKFTYVRLYPTAKYENGTSFCKTVPDVKAQLSGGPGGPLQHSRPRPMRVLVRPGAQRPTREERANLQESFYFFNLPKGWRDHNYTLVAEINPGCERPDANCDKNTLELPLEFAPTQDINLFIYPVRYTRGGQNLLAPTDDLFEHLRYFMRVYPLSIGNFNLHVKEILEFNGDLSTANGWTRLLKLVNEQRPFSWRESTNAQYVALLHQNVFTGMVNRINGANLQAANGVKLQPDPNATGIIFAHEIGHTFGREHVRCGGPAGSIDFAYPYNGCNLSTGGADTYWGLDVTEVIDPIGTADFMSYGQIRWVSDYTYRALLARLQADAGALHRLPARSGDERLLVQGTVNLQDGTASLDEVYRFENPFYPEDVPGGAYTLELQDSSGQTLITDTFDLAVTVSGFITPTAGSFQRALPHDPRITRVVLKQGDTVLASRTASAHPPTVTVTFPNGGEMLEGEVTLRWTASDPDGDPLEYVVQYSADDGATWEAVAVGITETTASVDTSTLPGGNQSLIRVAASDGFHTAYDQSDATFRVPRKGPTVWIAEPPNGAIFPPGMRITLFGRAYDQDLNYLLEASLAWASDRDGPLGTGQELNLSSLSPGLHTITLTATDDEGMRGTANVQIFIGHRVFLPAVLSR